MESGIEALLALITHDKSARSSSKADFFDHICEREGIVKRIFLYQQRRFAKLGKAAASLLQALPVIRKVLDETDTSNQLTDSCQLYLESELFITELETLAYFNHYVTFPFLNCIEQSSQAEILVILPKLYSDLKDNKVDTLKNFVVNIPGLNPPILSSNLGTEIIQQMCNGAADAVQLQCGREYGFSNDKPRTTVLSDLNAAEIDGLPTNNLVTERDFSKFDRLARTAKSRNHKFKAKDLRNNMTLIKSNNLKIDRLSRKLSAILSTNENLWVGEQKEKLKQRIIAKIEKGNKMKDNTKKLLVDCKSWGGPFTNSKELGYALHNRPALQEFITKTELSYYIKTHKQDKMSRPELFRMNGTTHAEKLENLMLLLDDETTENRKTIANLPSNIDVMKALNMNIDTAPNEKENASNIANELCAVIWKTGAKYDWYLGYSKGSDENGYCIDHLHKLHDQSRVWVYPSEDDIQYADKDQILQCRIEGIWDISDSRNTKFKLLNEAVIEKMFQEHIQKL